jgi:hypothetical protein
MDTGGVVWLPGSGQDLNELNQACANAFGGGYVACNEMLYGGGTLVQCCPY